MENIVIVGAKRTPIGAFQGALSPLKTPQLGAISLLALQQLPGVDPQTIEEVYMGCVLPAGLGQAPARQAALIAGLSPKVPCTTINKVCGSGLKAVMLGVEQIKTGKAKVVLAGGMESMSGAPYLLEKARSGYRLGHGQLIDHMLFDGLQDAYGNGGLMGVFAEATAEAYGFTREEQDAFALESTRRALEALDKGYFKEEIISVEVKDGKGGSLIVQEDESPRKVKVDKIPQLKPAFKQGGTVTAANSSSISDGSAAVLLMNDTVAKKQGLSPLARVVGHVSMAQEPEWFTTAPVAAIKELCAQLKWTPEQVDLYEINEAFAVVTMAAIKDLSLSPEKVNVTGGACALGHPIGASGARVLVTLIHNLRRLGKKRGIATLCIGGGEAVAIAVEV